MCESALKTTHLDTGDSGEEEGFRAGVAVYRLQGRCAMEMLTTPSRDHSVGLQPHCQKGISAFHPPGQTGFHMGAECRG